MIFTFIHASENDIEEQKRNYDIIASLHKSFLCEIIFHKRYLKDPPYDLSYIDVGEGGGLLSGTFEQVNA